MYMGIDFKKPFTSSFHVARVAKLGHPTTGSTRIWSQSGNSSANKSGWETMCQHFLLSRLDLECRLSPALTWSGCQIGDSYNRDASAGLFQSSWVIFYDIRRKYFYDLRNCARYPRNPRIYLGRWGTLRINSRLSQKLGGVDSNRQKSVNFWKPWKGRENPWKQGLSNLQKKICDFFRSGYEILQVWSILGKMFTSFSRSFGGIFTVLLDSTIFVNIASFTKPHFGFQPSCKSPSCLRWWERA